MRLLRRVLEAPLALLILFEEWDWEPLKRRLARRLSALAPRRLSRLTRTASSRWRRPRPRARRW
jgi:hypothetical protein